MTNGAGSHDHGKKKLAAKGKKTATPKKTAAKMSAGIKTPPKRG